MEKETCARAELAAQADDPRHHAELVETKARVVAEAAVGSDSIPAARRFIAVVKASAGHEAGMAQEHEAVEVAVSRMEAARVFLANVKAEDGA